jgi:hypothetical protein
VTWLEVYDSVVISESELRRVLFVRLSMPNSCLDFKWGWDIRACSTYERGHVVERGWQVRSTFDRPESETGQVGRGAGRWWFIAEASSVSSVVRTAWLAIRQNIDHELHEAFRLDGGRVFDPHRDLELPASPFRVDR